MKLLVLTASLSFLLLAPLHAESPRDPQGNAKITKNEAEHIALRKYPGAHVTSGKLEKIHDQLIWSLQLATTGTGTKSIAVDAMTGRITGGDER